MLRSLPSPKQLATAQSVISRLLANGPQQIGDRDALALTVRQSRFSTRSQSVDMWLKENPIDDTVLRRRVLASRWAAPPSANPSQLTADTVLSSDEWHAVKHREPVQSQWDSTAALHDYLNDLLNCMMQTSRVFIGYYGRTRDLRVGLIVRLGANGLPCTRLCAALRGVPGLHMFIAWSQRNAEIITGFPIPGSALIPRLDSKGTRLDPGYPLWDNRIEVTS